MNPLRHFFHDLAVFPRDLKLLSVALFLWGAGDTLFFYVVPLYLARLGATPVQIGNVFSLSALASVCTMIPAGILADRWGRKKIMMTGWMLGTATGALMAIAGDLRWFTLGWIAYWLTGFVNPAITSYSTGGRGDLAPERALTMTYAGFALGTIISPALGGWIATQIGLRSLFAIATAMFALSSFVIFLLRPQPVTHVASEGHYRDLLGNRRFIAFCALLCGVWFVMWLGYPLAPNFLADVRGLSVAKVGALGSFNALGSLTLSLTLGRRPPRRAFVAAQGIVMIYLLILLRASWFGWIALAYVARSAVFVSRTLAEAQATRVVERSQWGLAFGTLETVAWTGAVLAPLLAGRLYAIQPALPFQLSFALLPVVMLLTYFFSPRPALTPGLTPDPPSAS
ncbi:MAG: MFS transporter [Chloroflexi bacterium]|nr:MFS transporter [Chloroflexota bacterium]MBI3761031.1 MFS transporter [Chloroflexota bacterium]